MYTAHRLSVRCESVLAERSSGSKLALSVALHPPLREPAHTRPRKQARNIDRDTQTNKNF